MLILPREEATYRDRKKSFKDAVPDPPRDGRAPITPTTPTPPTRLFDNLNDDDDNDDERT